MPQDSKAYSDTNTSSSGDYWSALRKPILWQNRQNRQMKKILPALSTLATVLATAAALAQPSLPHPPGEGRGEGAPVQAAPLPPARSAPALPPANARSEGSPGRSIPPALISNLTQVPPSLNANSATISVGDQLLKQVATQLARHASISAQIKHQVTIYGQQFGGTGNYWQQGSGESLKTRLELRFQGQDAQLLQVCDSRFIWTDRTLPTGRNVSRIDLRTLRSDPTLADASLSDIKPGQANWSTIDLTSYTGGLPTLITSLGENFTFMPPQAMRLKPLEPTLPEKAPNTPAVELSVYAVVGHWKPEKLAALISKAQAAAIENNAAADPNTRKPLPERMPEEVLLLVGQADSFPYRIEYRRLETPQLTGTDGTPIPYQLSVHPMVVLELSNVVFDAKIAPGQFDYAPGNADWTDQTTATLDHLRQQRQPQVAKRGEDGSQSPVQPMR